MTALELLERMKSKPEGRWVDREMDRLSGIAAPGDVDPMLARQYVIGRVLVEVLTGGGSEHLALEPLLRERRGASLDSFVDRSGIDMDRPTAGVDSLRTCS